MYRSCTLWTDRSPEQHLVDLFWRTMKYFSDFMWLFSTCSSLVIAGFALGLLTLTALDGGYSAGKPAGASQTEAALKTRAARQAALERVAAFVAQGENHVQPAVTGVPALTTIVFSGYKHALAKPSAALSSSFVRRSDITGSIPLAPAAQPKPPIDTLWRVNTAKP